MNEPVLLDVPARLPGHCICGAVGQVIDTKLEVDGYGRVYLCTNTCAVQAASLIGWTSPEEVAILHGQLDEMAARLEPLEERVSIYDKPLAEIIDFAIERAKRRPQETTAA